MSKDKALIFDLSSSISYGRLSLLGKVLWPMLLIKSDDQGRGQAEPDVIKWRVCPNVPELAIENIEDVLEEMTDERVGLLHLYEDCRGRKLYQIIRWWETELGTGSYLQWARPSEHKPPDGWTDRIRVAQGRGKPPIVSNWDHAGGFSNGVNPAPIVAIDIPTDEGTDEPPSEPTDEPEPIIEYNRIESNLRESNTTTTANAVQQEEKPPEKGKVKGQERAPPLTDGQRGFLDLFGAKRYRTNAQKEAVLELEKEHGTEKLLEAARWAAEHGMNVGKAIAAVRTALPNWGKPKGKGARASPQAAEPKSWKAIRKMAEQEGVDWQSLTP